MKPDRGEWLIKNFGDRNRLERMQPESNVPRAVMELGDANGIAKKIIPMSVTRFQDHAVAVTSRETSFVAETVVVIKCPDDMIVVVVPHLVADMAVVVVEAAVVVIKKAMDCHVMVVVVVEA